LVLKVSGALPRFRVRKVEKPPYVVDKSRLRRFSRRNTVFNRVSWDSSWRGYGRRVDDEGFNLIRSGREGYSRIDFALARASWMVRRLLRPYFRKRIEFFGDWSFSVKKGWLKIDRYVEEPAEMSRIVKRAARFFGASLVGVCRLNRDWLYAEVDLPEKFENVIVMAIEMDSLGIATSPAAPASAATGLGYSKMAFVLACLGEFIRNLGYDAIESGNDIALSIPLAIDAGLGELGRNGLLITPQYGPRVRLCKIFTDLPLEPDKPIEFGVKEFCRECKLCAKYCEAGAISMDDEPSFDGVCPSNNPGVLKWYVDVEKCYLFWLENGMSCSTCIKVCPYNIISSRRSEVSPRDFWKL